MTTLAIKQNQTKLLDELVKLIPNYDGIEVIHILQSAIADIRKCKRTTSNNKAIEQNEVAQEISSLIGIVPNFSEEELAKDERLSHILSHYHNYQ